MTHPHFLIPENAPRQRPSNDPYTRKGAANIIKANQAQVIEMLQFMADNLHDNHVYTFLALSPLRRTPWLAAAMKTMGLIDESPSVNGSCRLVLAQHGFDILARLERSAA